MIRKIKIVIIILVALVTSALMSNTLFLAGTPYINKPFIAQLINSPGIFVKNMNDYVASLSGGREGINSYQAQRVQEYVAQQNGQLGTLPSGQTPSENPLPAPRNADDFRAQGYTEIAKGAYRKQDVAAHTIEYYFTAETKFEQTQEEVNGKQMTVWRPL